MWVLYWHHQVFAFLSAHPVKTQKSLKLTALQFGSVIFMLNGTRCRTKKPNQLGLRFSDAIVLFFFFSQVIFSDEFYPERQNPLQPHKNCGDRTVANFISYLHFCCKPYMLFQAVPSPLQDLFPRGVRHPAFQLGCSTQQHTCLASVHNFMH